MSPCCPPPSPGHPPHPPCHVGESTWLVGGAGRSRTFQFAQCCAQSSVKGSRLLPQGPEHTYPPGTFRRPSRLGCSTVNTLAERRPGRGSGQRSRVSGPGPAPHTPHAAVRDSFAAGLRLRDGKGGRALPSRVGVLGLLSLLHLQFVSPMGGPPPPPRPCWGLTVPPTGAVAAPRSRTPRLRADGSRGSGVLPSWFSSVRESAPSQVGVRPALQIPGIEVPLLSRERPQPPGTECGSGAEEPEGLSGPRRDPTGCPWSRARQMLGPRERACASLGMGSGQVWRCPSLGAKGGVSSPCGSR